MREQLAYPESHMDLLQAPGVAVLATLNHDGFVQATAIWYLLDDDGVLKISSNSLSHKVRNLRERPVCTFFLLDLANPERYVEVRARADVVRDEGNVVVGKMSAKYGTDLLQWDPPRAHRLVVMLTPAKINTR